MSGCDFRYLSFEQIALPVAVERGVATQAIKAFRKAGREAATIAGPFQWPATASTPYTCS